jgi:tetratricopeptide (TPR) repeat protein
MTSRVVLALAVVLLASLAAAQGGPPQRPVGPPAPQSEQMKAGVAHFDKAFYDLTPRNRHAEAAAEFDLAVAAFERELAVLPGSAQAHTYLARIHAARKDYRKAGEHYDQVAAIESQNVDACVLAALAYLDANDAVAARGRLLQARARTTDPAVLARLDEYISRVDARIR